MRRATITTTVYVSTGAYVQVPGWGDSAGGAVIAVGDITLTLNSTNGTDKIGYKFGSSGGVKTILSNSAGNATFTQAIPAGHSMLLDDTDSALYIKGLAGTGSVEITGFIRNAP